MRIFNIKVIKVLAPLNKAILAIIIEDFPGNCGHHRRSGDKNSSNVGRSNNLFQNSGELNKGASI